MTSLQKGGKGVPRDVLPFMFQHERGVSLFHEGGRRMQDR